MTKLCKRNLVFRKGKKIVLKGANLFAFSCNKVLSQSVLIYKTLILPLQFFPNMHIPLALDKNPPSAELKIACG